MNGGKPFSKVRKNEKKIVFVGSSSLHVKSGQFYHPQNV